MSSSCDGVTIVDHPLVQHKLTLLRDKNRSTKVFRELFNEIGALLCYEVTRDLPLENDRDRNAVGDDEIADPRRQEAGAGADRARRHAAFSRACSNLLPSARVAHIGLYRDPRTLVAVEYFFKAPDDIAERLVLVLHPMLATGNSAVAAVDRLKEAGAKTVRIVCLLATPQGVDKVQRASSRRSYLDRGDRRRPQRGGYILPGRRRCRRPHVRDALAVDISIDVVTLKPGFQHGDLPKFGMPLGG